jgi:hypothetical protein
MSKNDLNQSPTIARRRKLVTAAACTAILLFSLFAQAGAGLEKTLLDADFYRALSSELEVPTLVQSYLLKRLFARENMELLPDSFLYRAVAAAASPEWLGQQIDKAAGELLALLKGEQETLVLAVNLRERKDVFKDELIGGLSRVQLEKLELTGSFVETFIEQAGFPDELILADFSPVDDPGSGAESALRLVRQARGFYRVLPYLALGALLLLYCYWRGPVKGLGLFGGTLFAGGLSGLLGLYTAAPLLLAAAAHRIPALEGASASSISANPHLAASAVRIIQQSLLPIPLKVAASGLTLLLAGQIFKPVFGFYYLPGSRENSK